MAEELAFRDPHRGHELRLVSVPADRLEVVGHQRRPSPPHVERVARSIDKLGFLVPLVAVAAPEGDRYLVIDGQHRLLAARQLGIAALPVVVVPGELAERMMGLNVEKEPNIRERAYVALGIYRELADSKPALREDGGELEEAIEHAHYVTLGLAYERAARLPGSAFEPILKRCDGFLPLPLTEALGVRGGRAVKVEEAYAALRRVADKLKAEGVDHPYLTNQILAAANPLKRKRGAVDFDRTLDALIEALGELESDPMRVLREPA